MVEKAKTFVKVVQDKERKWVTHAYYGIEGLETHGDLTASGAVVLKQGIVVNGILMNVVYQELLYHRDMEGNVLFDERVF